MKANTTYYIQMSHAVNGKVVMSDEILEVTTEEVLDLSVAAELSGSELTLKWNVNGNSYKYWVTVVRDGKSQVISTTNTTYTLTNFDPATCTVSIRGINSNGTYDYEPVVVNG